MSRRFRPNVHGSKKSHKPRNLAAKRSQQSIKQEATRAKKEGIKQIRTMLRQTQYSRFEFYALIRALISMTPQMQAHLKIPDIEKIQIHAKNADIFYNTLPIAERTSHNQQRTDFLRRLSPQIRAIMRHAEIERDNS